MPEARTVRFQIQLGRGLEIVETEVVIYRVTRGEPERLESLTVHSPTFTCSLPTGGGRPFYAVAEIRKLRQDGAEFDAGERRVQLVSTFSESAERVALSEPVTVATVYAFCRFLHRTQEGGVELSDPHDAWRIADRMKGNFVTTSGEISRVIRCSPNGLETNSYALFNFLSNLVYYGLVSPEVYRGFLRLTEADSFFAALLYLARNPFLDPEALYALISERQQIFTPSLPELEPPASPVPDQWTLTVKVNDSGARNFLIAGVGFIVFDKNDRAWLTNNVRQGTPCSSTFCVILEPDGSPAPFSPLFGGGLLGAGFGVAADPAGEKIYLGSFGWGPTEWNPETGSVAVFNHRGEVLSPPNGYTQGLSRVQGMAFDPHGNLWICSWGSQDPMPPTDSRFHFKSGDSGVAVYLGGDPGRVVTHSFDSPYHLTFDVAFDAEGHAYVSNSGSSDHGVRSSVCKLRLEDGAIRELARWESDHPRSHKSGEVGFEALRQVAVAPGGDVYVVAVASSRVIRLDRDLRFRGEIKKNIHGPWGITFDRQGTMFVANFAREVTFEAPVDESIGPFGVTVIPDGDERQARLMTLPTGGHEVRLANGLPLYGNPETSSGKAIPVHSYDPLMRLTATSIDRAGNLWAANNWKPSAAIDVVRGDPGGDGVVIFVGAAEPAGRREG